MSIRDELNSMEWIEKYGIQFFDHEDDWGWTVLGTPSSRRILAAINWLARDYGVKIDLSEATPDGLDDFQFTQKVAINVRECVEEPGSYTWDWAAPAFTAAGHPMTVVTLR